MKMHSMLNRKYQVTIIYKFIEIYKNITEVQ